MHLLVPFAAPLADAGRTVLRGLALPRLAALLAGWTVEHEDDGDEWSLSTPHERALARAWGWAGADGALPWAAQGAADDGIEPGDLAWGLLTPAHWHLGTDQVSLIDPTALALDETGSRALLDAVRDLFEDEGWLLRWGAPLRWYAAHESLATVRTASPDRVIGRNVDRWLPEGAAARPLRRLQMEVQMRLHEHPLNAEREARGELVVNSFWLSGCGVAQPRRGGAGPAIDDRLRTPALAEDWAAWSAAWAALDAGPLAALLAEAAAGRPARLTLAGERRARTLAPAARGLWQRVASAWPGRARTDPAAWLAEL